MAARIVTGLPVFASLDSLYFETGWEPLSSRRQAVKLTNMFKIHNNLVPQYLKEVCPDTRGNTSSYHTRNSNDYTLPRCRLEVFKKSFIPDTVKKWNGLSTEVRGQTSIEKFKKHIRKIPSKPPLYYSYGHRYLNIIHTKLRHSCILNSDLYRKNIITSPNCICGQFENAQHFFFECSRYTRARNSLFDELLVLDNVNVVDTHLLLWGNELFSDDINFQIFTAVHKFIKNSKRFYGNQDNSI